MISEKIMEILACPACKGDVKLTGDTIRCQKCRRIYPVKNDIPVMLIEESRMEEDNGQ